MNVYLLIISPKYDPLDLEIIVFDKYGSAVKELKEYVDIPPETNDEDLLREQFEDFHGEHIWWIEDHEVKKITS